MTASSGVGSFDVLAAAVLFLIFGCTIVLIGGLVMRYPALDRALRIDNTPDLATMVRHRLRAVERLAAVVLLPAILLRLVLELRDFTGNLGWLLVGPGMLTGMTWGKGWVIQAVGIGAVLSGQSAEPRRRDRETQPVSGGGRGSVRRRLTAGGILALTVGLALTGHAVVSPTHPLLVAVADSLHVAAAGVWLGTASLLLVAAVSAGTQLPREKSAVLVARLTRAFAPLAVAAAGTVFITGAVGTWLHLDRAGASPGTPYNRLVAAKLGLFVLLVAAGAYDWRHAASRATTERGVYAMKWSVTAQVAFGTVLLVLTAILVAMAPSGDG